MVHEDHGEGGPAPEIYSLDPFSVHARFMPSGASAEPVACATKASRMPLLIPNRSHPAKIALSHSLGIRGG
jgi:hypothetical protein